MTEPHYISWEDFSAEERMLIGRTARDVLILEQEVKEFREEPHPSRMIPAFKLFDLFMSPEPEYHGKREWLRNYIKRVGKGKGYNGIYPHTFPEDIRELIDGLFPS